MVFAQYPEILSRARQEQLDLVSQDPANLTTGSLTMAQLKQMPYLVSMLPTKTIATLRTPCSLIPIASAQNGQNPKDQNIKGQTLAW